MSTSVRSAAHTSRYTTSSAPVTAEATSTTWSATATATATSTGPSTWGHRSNSGATRVKSTTLDSQSAVDQYAQRVLIQAAHEAQRNENTTIDDDDDVQGIMIDESLGPYVTSCLRTSTSTGRAAVTDVTDLLEFDCLCELIQEHCQIEHRTVVVPIIQRIATAVFSGVVPETDDTIPTHTTIRTSSATSGIAASVRLDADVDHGLSTLSLSSSVAAPSTVTRSLSDQHIEKADQTTEFLKASSSVSLNNAIVSQASTYLGQPSSANDSPTQSIVPMRQQSMEAYHNLPLHYGANTSTAAVSSSSVPPLDESEPPFDPDLYHQQIVAHYLQTIHTDVSDDAAWEATSMAQGHWNVASHLIECASNQLPLCRNLLTHGCYRADCSFSHDRERHTCLFWLRTKCTKHADCTFRHGFDPDHLTTAPEPDLTSFYDPTSYEMYHQNDFHEVNGNDNNLTGINNLHSSQPTSLWIPNPPPMQPTSDIRTAQSISTTSSSFANIASQGYASTSFSDPTNAASARTIPTTTGTVRIPQSLWNPHEQRCDATAFYIADPLERYRTVNAQRKKDDNVIDLHFQSLQTFAVVLDSILPTKLARHESVWIITGTGHSVRTQTHQKGGGALEAAVWDYLVTRCGSNVTVQQGRDRNGQGGAIFVQTKHASTATR